MSEISETVLGVEKSAGGRRWVSREGDARAGLALAQRFGVPEIVGRVMAARGIGIDDAESWLNPTLRALLPDPRRLKDMDWRKPQFPGSSKLVLFPQSARTRRRCCRSA